MCTPCTHIHIYIYTYLPLALSLPSYPPSTHNLPQHPSANPTNTMGAVFTNLIDSLFSKELEIVR